MVQLPRKATSSKQSQLNPVTNNSKAIAAALPKPCEVHNMPPCALDAAHVARMFKCLYFCVWVLFWRNPSLFTILLLSPFQETTSFALCLLDIWILFIEFRKISQLSCCECQTSCEVQIFKQCWNYLNHENLRTWTELILPCVYIIWTFWYLE